MSEEVQSTPAPSDPTAVLEMSNLPDPSAGIEISRPEPPAKISMADLKAQLAEVKKDHKNPDLRPKPVPQEAALAASEQVMPEGNGEGEDVVTPEAVAPQMEATDQGGKKKGIKNPFARARIVEKERNEAQAALRDLQIEIARLRAAQEAAQAKVDVAKEEGPGPDAGPVELLMAEVKSIKSAIEQSKQEAQAIIARAQAENALLAVDQRIASVMEEAPEVMSGAISHLARVVQAQYEERFPDHTEQERFAMAQQAIQQKKLEWASNGLDPAEQMYRLATTYGYIPPESSDEEASAEAPKSKQVKKLTPVEEIKVAKERQAATKSLGAIPGRSVGSVAAKSVATPSELRDAISRAQQSGALPRRAGKAPTFGEMAAMFGIKPVSSR